MVAVGVAAAALQAGRADRPTLQGEGTSWQLASERSGKHVARVPRGTFRIGGSVGGLYPGDSTELVLTVSNPQRFPIVVSSISTIVNRPRAACSASYLRVGRFSGHLRVRTHASAQVSVVIALAEAAPDACQGMRFELRYHGLAQRGSR